MSVTKMDKWWWYKIEVFVRVVTIDHALVKIGWCAALASSIHVVADLVLNAARCLASKSWNIWDFAR